MKDGSIGLSTGVQNLKELGAENGLVDLGFDLLVDIGVSEIVVGDTKAEKVGAWGRRMTGSNCLKVAINFEKLKS